MSTIHRDRIRSFLARRRANSLGLLFITLLSALTTCIFALTGSSKTGLLVIVTVCLVLLCFLQAIKMDRSFRTIRDFRGRRKKPQQRRNDPAL